MEVNAGLGLGSVCVCVTQQLYTSPKINSEKRQQDNWGQFNYSLAITNIYTINSVIQIKKAAWNVR